MRRSTPTRQWSRRTACAASASCSAFPATAPATLLRARSQDPLDPTPLKRLDVPTLIIWGAQDRWVPVADAFRFQGDIKGAKLAIFEKPGHNPMEEDPKGTAAAVAAFLPTSRRRRFRKPPPTPSNSDQVVAPSVVPEKD